MKDVVILVPHKARISSIEDTRHMFLMVNDYLTKSGKQSVFNIRLAGLTKEVRLEKGLYAIITDNVIGEIERTDLIIIPSLSGDMVTPFPLNINFNPWLIQQYRKGAEIASLCLGSFLLASTGLLKGNHCSTHWQYANEFRAFFPGVKMADDKIVTEQNGIYTSGGGTLYWNLLLRLVEKFTDKETAIWASKYFALDVTRHSQSPFAIFNGQKEHSDKDILGVQEFIERNFAEKISVEEIADRFYISRRTLERRFFKATANSIIEYIQRVRIEAAKKSLELGRSTVNEVMFEVGYTDINSFRRVFHRITGRSPRQYREAYAS
jgi:transcriptional regulator GlxA family with amidase domain